MTFDQQPLPWNDTIRALPYAHILQTEEWGRFKQRTTGWNYEKTYLGDGPEAGAPLFQPDDR